MLPSLQTAAKVYPFLEYDTIPVKYVSSGSSSGSASIS
jgi:formate-dependent nitrite reductase membrane component NrfD